MGAYRYGGAVDVWAIGCIVAEMLQRAPLFAGESDLDQYAKMTHVLGSPSEDNWKNVRSLPSFIDVKKCDPIPLEHIFRAATADMLDLIRACLTYEPTKRVTCEEALRMPVFLTKKPFPSHPSTLPIPGKVRARQQKEANDAAIQNKKRLRLDAGQDASSDWVVKRRTYT